MAVTGLVGATAIAAGASHSCALLVGGTGGVLGAQHVGSARQPGGDASPRRKLAPPPITKVPVPVTNLTGVTAIGAGVAVLVRAAGRRAQSQCWGLNNSGQLGQQLTASTRRFPALVSGMVGSTGGDRDRVRRAPRVRAAGRTGSVECWGDNEEGQLGNGTIADSAIPVPVIGLTERHRASWPAGTSRVRCWSTGRCGAGDTTCSGSSATAASAACRRCRSQVIGLDRHRRPRLG